MENTNDYNELFICGGIIIMLIAIVGFVAGIWWAFNQVKKLKKMADKKKYFIPVFGLTSEKMKSQKASDRSEWWLLIIGLAYVVFR